MWPADTLECQRMPPLPAMEKMFWKRPQEMPLYNSLSKALCGMRMHLLRLSSMYSLMMGWTPVAHDLRAHKHSQGVEEERPGCGAGFQRWQHLLYSGLKSHRSTLMRPPRPPKCILFPFPLLSSSCSFPTSWLLYSKNIFSFKNIFIVSLPSPFSSYKVSSCRAETCSSPFPHEH